MAYATVQEIGMNFQSAPEFHANPELVFAGCASLDTALAYKLFNTQLYSSADGTNQQTLLSPANYYNFETLLKLSDWSAIQATFGMDQTQAGCIDRWVGSFTVYHPEQVYANMLT